ncbi:MAG: hypothetical protein AB3X44_13105 [Leptothrix sp. (in: b-proteobacteria)]
MLKYRLLSASIALALGLGACGGGSSSSTGPTTSSTGVLVDDLIAGAQVFCDSNSNGVLDSGEAVVSTDDNGAYTFSPACEAPIVSVAGTGMDLTSLRAPRGHFRARANSQVVSPFTTMLVESGLTLAEFQAVMVKLGLGNIDPGSFDPTAPGNAAKLQTALAVAKLLNDLAAIVEANGGDAEAAFKAAATQLTMTLQNKTLTGASLFDDDTDLGDVIDAASDKAFDSVPDWKADTSGQKKSNAKKIAREGVSATSKAIRNASNHQDVEDSFRNEGTAHLIADTHLDDDNESSANAKQCKDDQNFSKAQFVYSTGNALKLIGASSTIDTTLTALAASGGVNTNGLSLGNITRIEMPLKDSGLALSKTGQKVQIGLEVTEVGGNRKLQILVDKVLLQRDTVHPGQAVVSVLQGAGLRFYARTASGIELYPAEPLRNNTANLLSNSSNGTVGIDLAVITDRLLSNFSSDANKTSLINKMLSDKGTFQVRVIVSDIDFRLANGTTLPTQKIRIVNTGQSLSGAGFTGRLVF